MTDTPKRPLRADALRNRIKIFDAAREQITTHGTGAGMDEIAAAAGVAVGTLYRHFPTKRDLVAAIVGEFLADVATRTEKAAVQIQNGASAFSELTELLREIVAATATNQAAKAAAETLGAETGDTSDLQRAAVAMNAIIEECRAAGVVRDDLSIDDLYLIVSNIPAGQSPEALDRWVDLVLFGISARARG